MQSGAHGEPLHLVKRVCVQKTARARATRACEWAWHVRGEHTTDDGDDRMNVWKITQPRGSRANAPRRNVKLWKSSLDACRRIKTEQPQQNARLSDEQGSADL